MISFDLINFMTKYLHAVQCWQMELGELKGRLAEVKSNRDALCKKTAADGLESSVKQIAVASDVCLSNEYSANN